MDWSGKSYSTKRNGKDTVITVPPYTALIGHAIYYVRQNNLDSMYHYLQLAIDEGFDHQMVFLNYYEDFYPVYDLPKTVETRKKMHNNWLSSFDSASQRDLAERVKEMLERDQFIRWHYDYCENVLKYDSLQLEEVKADAKRIDSKNQASMIKILDKYGYPGKSLVGQNCAGNAFFIIQHFPDLAMQKKYYPLLKKAAEEGEMQMLLLQMLEDRINVREGKEQKHGTQTINK